jgi:hypothetical protein
VKSFKLLPSSTRARSEQLPSVYSGHKFDPTRNRFELPIVRKLLRSKGKLVAGGGIEPPTLEL